MCEQLSKVMNFRNLTNTHKLFYFSLIHTFFNLYLYASVELTEKLFYVDEDPGLNKA